MGLYDTIVCLHPLPTNIPNLNNRIFQTKSILSPCLRAYQINQDGSLTIENCVNEINKNGFEIKSIPTIFSGDIKFYTFYNDETNEGWIEFLATFKNGKLIDDIKIVEITEKELI